MSTTAHDSIIMLLAEVTDGMSKEAPSPLAKLLIRAAKPIITQIRNEQSYDPEVLALLDKIESL
jgi:hypothetical protein